VINRIIIFGLLNFILFITGSLLFRPVCSNYIPFDISVWSEAGYPGEIPVIDCHIINVIEEGAVLGGETDNYRLIQSLVDKVVSPAVIFFPEGTYRINGQLELKTGIVLRGEGSESTHLEFNSDDGCINLKGTFSGQYTKITGGLTLNSSHIKVDDASNFKISDGAHIRQGNVIETTYKEWINPYSPGQIVRITAIDGNSLSFNPPLNYDYASNPPLNAEEGPEISRLEFIEEVGIENLHIKRLHSSDVGGFSNIIVRGGANFWIKDVESEYTLKYHFAIAQSLNFEIRECYIHGARDRGNGGQGYGVSLASQSTAGLVEDNIFY
jgi:hypothetical protein